LNIHPDNQTRWDARRGYHDPNIERTNFNVQTNSQVTKILFDEGETLNATGVEFASSPYAPRETVFARREVMLAAGAIQTPQLLELSGIGQRSILEPLGITVHISLPGVGNNLQDHAMLRLSYDYTNTSVRDINDFFLNSTFNDESAAEFFASRTGPWTGRPSGAVAFPSLRQVTNDTRSRILRAQSVGDYLPPTYADEATLRAGFEAQAQNLLKDLDHIDTPAFEILNDNAGGLHLALMRPMSRGTTHITTTDPFELPSVDPRWLEHPFDFDIMILAMQTNQRILRTAAIQQLRPSYPDVPEDADPELLAAIIRTGTGTQFHYSCTAAMLPRHLGGVVSDDLLVYGTSNLRVVDTSIYPLVPGAHTQAVAFGTGEKAADIIKLAR
jgi:choline dehydrogenase-like flavoprotein